MRAIALSFVAVLAVAAALAAPVAPAAAQLRPIIVTATRFPEDARRLPASTTVLTAREIERSTATTLPELLATQAGIHVRDLFGNSSASAFVDMRGFGATASSNTLILVDGRRITDIDFSSVQWAAIPLQAIERIEILRGTGAVLYGDAATAGVVNIILRSPLDQGRGAGVTVRGSSFRSYEGSAYGSYSSGSLGASGSLQAIGANGYRANNRNDQRNAMLNLRYGSEQRWLDLRFGLDNQDLRLPGARRVQPSSDLDELGEDRRGAQTPLDWSNRIGRRAGATFGTRLGAAELNAGLDWRSKEQEAYFDQGGFPSFNRDNLDLVSFTPRVRIPATLLGVEHRLTLGADMHAWQYESHRSNAPENIGTPVNVVTVDDDMLGFYAQDVLELSARTSLVLGLRRDRVRFDASDRLDPDAPGADFASEAPPVEATQHQNAWEAALRHDFSGSLTAFARAQRSFRFVNANEIYESNASFSREFQILRPQNARSYEVGAEYSVSRFALQAALFQTDVRDEIHLDPFTSGVGNTNLPPSRRRGVEAQAGWMPTEALNVRVAHTYTQARFLEGVLPGSEFAIGEDIDISGRTVPLVPEHRTDIGVQWTAPGAVQVSTTLGIVSEQFMDNDEPNTLGTMIPAYTLFDVKLSRAVPWGRVSALVSNLLDEEYFTYGVRSQFTADRWAAYPLPGRAFSLVAELRWP